MDKPYYQDEWLKHYYGDCLSILPELPDESVDLLATDPPYGISFMGKDWDKALPDIRVWRECYRVLKAGSFAFVMSIPRADCLSRMIISLEDAGFWVNFTPIFWAYASGFPKAQNIGKAVDKRLGVERGRMKPPQVINGWRESENRRDRQDSIPDNNAITPQAKALDGSYGGFQPKPAVEVIIVAMKPLSEKTFVDQALTNKKGITWLDDCRIPYESEGDKGQATPQGKCTSKEISAIGAEPDAGRAMERVGFTRPEQIGRFPANLLVSDDVLNDGVAIESKDKRQGGITPSLARSWANQSIEGIAHKGYIDSGSFSRYFDLDKWWAKTFPFLIVPKASKGEKNKLVEGIESDIGHNRFDQCAKCGGYILQNPDRPSACKCENPVRQNNKIKGNVHPTVKPLKLMSYLVTLGSREGDTVLDPYMGSGTTPLACQLLNRHCIGIEIKERYCEISAKRCSQRVFDFASVTKRG